MELKITGSLVLELGDYIDTIESYAGDFMLPNPEGLFLPGQCEPVLYSDRRYYYAGPAIDNVAQPVLIRSLDHLDDDVYNDRAELVVAKKQIKHLSSKPRYSLRARNMLVEIIDHLIQNHARWSGTQARGRKQSNVHAAIRPFLIDKLQRSGIAIEGVLHHPASPYDPDEIHSNENVSIDLVSEEDKAVFYAGVEICDSIMLQLGEMTGQLISFLGQDRWIMHFTKLSNTMLTIEKTIDYRIYAWMMEHGRGFED